MKKKWIVAALIVLCLSVAVYGTVAYFTHEQTVTNVITAGNIKLSLHYYQLTEAGPETVEGPADILPGTSVSRVVTVENTGNNPAWVRISVEKAVELAAGTQGEADLTLIGLDLNTQHWTERDGYYYYNTALEPGQTTEPLFTQLTFAENMGNLYQNSTVVVTVLVQGVQTAHNGETVWDAAGWPENP